uniref:lysozyme n=1 Tax=Anopheles farauti TaxID=69004 RepID=A0A182R1A9_9DIPT
MQRNGRVSRQVQRVRSGRIQPSQPEIQSVLSVPIFHVSRSLFVWAALPTFAAKMVSKSSVIVGVCFIAIGLACIGRTQADVSHVAPSEDPVTDVCLSCICEASSGCDASLRCNGDVCGMFRITWAYWTDAGKPVQQGDSPDSQNAYANCVNEPYCAARTVQGYMRKFGQDCNGDGTIDCFDHAIIHKLGGYNCKNQVPIVYQSKIDECIQRKAVEYGAVRQ